MITTLSILLVTTYHQVSSLGALRSPVKGCRDSRQLFAMSIIIASAKRAVRLFSSNRVKRAVDARHLSKQCITMFCNGFSPSFFLPKDSIMVILHNGLLKQLPQLLFYKSSTSYLLSSIQASVPWA